MSYADEILSDAPLGYWRLGESSGTTAEDSSGNNLDGTYEGTFTLGAGGLLTGDADTALALSGAGAVNLSNPAELEVYTDVTLEIWLSNLSGAGTQWLIAKDGDSGARGFGLGVSGGQVYVERSGGMLLSGGDVSSGTHHVVLTIDSNEWNLYVDGSLVAGPSAQAALTENSATRWYIGRRHYGGAEQRISATLDDAAIYGAGLSAERVLAHYEAGITEPEEEPTDRPFARFRRPRSIYRLRQLR